MQEAKDGIRLLTIVLLAIIGGALGYMSKEISLGRKLAVSRVILSGVSAGFIGLLVFWACGEFNLSHGTTSVVVGLCSYMGTDVVVDLFKRVLYKKLGIDYGYTVVGSSDSGDISSSSPLVRKLSDVCIPKVGEAGTGPEVDGPSS